MVVFPFPVSSPVDRSTPPMAYWSPEKYLIPNRFLYSYASWESPCPLSPPGPYNPNPDSAITCATPVETGIPLSSCTAKNASIISSVIKGGSPCPVAGCWSKNPPIRDMITLTIREIANTATKRKASMVTSTVKSAAASCITIAAPASTTLPIVAPTYFTKDGRSPTCAFCCLLSSSFARSSPIACWAAWFTPWMYSLKVCAVFFAVLVARVAGVTGAVLPAAEAAVFCAPAVPELPPLE